MEKTNEGVQVILCRVGLAPELRTLPTGDEERFEAMRKLVGGWLEMVPLDEPTGLELWCNENGIAEGLALNWVIPAKAREKPSWLEGFEVFAMGDDLADYGEAGEWRIHGDFFMARSNDEGETVSATDADRKWAESVWEKYRAVQVAADRFVEVMKRVNTAVERVSSLVVEGRCQPPPFGCGKVGVTLADFRDDESRSEYQISALCQECQDRVFSDADPLFGKEKLQERIATARSLKEHGTCPKCGENDWNTTTTANGLTNETTGSTTFCRRCAFVKEQTP